jgi:hypothetical protein
MRALSKHFPELGLSYADVHNNSRNKTLAAFVPPHVSHVTQVPFHTREAGPTYPTQ